MRAMEKTKDILDKMRGMFNHLADPDEDSVELLRKIREEEE
jgi:hypothetical protein